MKAYPMIKVDAAGAAGCLALMGAAYLSGFGPLLRERVERTAQTTALAERQAEFAGLQETMRTLGERHRRYEEELEQHPVRLHHVSEINQRLALIVKRAEECGLRVPDIAPQAQRTDARFTIVPIVLRGTGGYTTAAHFFAGLHREFKDTAVTGFTLTAADPTDAGRVPEWSANAVGPPPPSIPARADFVFELSWFAAPADHSGGMGK